MAKARTAFGLWKGSTKSKTFSVLKGWQIIKDRVDNVANPQTRAQMLTRLSLSTVSIAAQRMTDLVGISFAGISNITDAKRKFSSINVSRLIKSYKAGESVYFTAKGIPCLIPNAYQVSKGTLGSCALKTAVTGSAGLRRFVDPDIVVNIDAGQEYNARDLVRVLFGCEPGDQLTAVEILNGIEMMGYDESHEWLRDFQMASQRLVFKSEDELLALDPVNFGVSSTAAEVQTAIRSLLSQAFDASKSHTKMINFFLDDYWTVTKGTNVFTVTGSPTTVASSTGYTSYANVIDTDSVKALGFFRSHLETSGWNYTSCILSLIDAFCSANNYASNDAKNYGLQFETALGTYAQAQSESVRYTQAGGSQNELGSFQ